MKAALPLVFLIACHAPARTRPPPLVVISLDGLRPAELGAGKLPELRRMRAEGSFASVRGVLPTVTYPSHTTMMTGVDPRTHGVHANQTFDPEERNAGGWYWYAEDVRVPTLWDACEKAGLPSASLFWPVNVGARARFTLAEVWRSDTGDDRKLTRALSTPGLVAEMERDLGELPGGRVWDLAADRARARFAARVLEEKRPRFATLHLLALDHEEHLRGPGGAEVRGVLEQLDGLVTAVRVAADRIDGPANVCVVSDHGFHAVHTRINFSRAFEDAKLLERSGWRVTGWKAAMWPSGGTGAVMLHDPDDREAEAAVKALLDRLAAQPELGIDRVLDRAAARALGGFPDASFVVAMKPGFVADVAWDAPLVTPSPNAGHHGYLPSDPAMNAVFLCAGPSVPKGRDLGTIAMRDVAPSLATLLGVPFPSAEGKSAF